jgi:isopenicillin-N epimerase
MSFAGEFDPMPGLLYLNSGTHSLTPRSVLDAISRGEREYETNPTAQLMRVWGRLWNVQKRLGAFLRADPKSLFLRQNVTEAMNAFILGVPLPMGSEILLSDLEYQAVENIALYRAERDGATVRKFHLPVPEAGRMTPREIADLVAGELRPETGLLILSHVFTGNGMVLPIAEIAARARAQGVLLAVDGAHAAGALDLDFGALGDVDFYGSNLHKWMLGPKGTGFGWVSPRHHEALRPLEAGWATFESPNEYKPFGDGARFPARFLMQGCRNFAPFFAIEDMLAFWDKHGAAEIRARVRSLQKFLEAEVAAKLGWTPLSPPLDGGARGPLTTYELPPHLEKEGYELMSRLLREHGLQISMTRMQGRWRMRFSPHVYVTEENIARAVEILAAEIPAAR